MFARVTTTRGQAKREDVERVIQQQLIPQVKDIPGFKGAYWLRDEKTGKGLAITLWESEDALNVSAAPAGQLRTKSTSDLGIEVESVESFEVIKTAEVPAEVSA